jgi:hypothetical protein
MRTKNNGFGAAAEFPLNRHGNDFPIASDEWMRPKTLDHRPAAAASSASANSNAGLFCLNTSARSSIAS